MHGHKPVLQIAHISDMHFVHPEFERKVSEAVLRRLLRRFDRLRPALPASFETYWDSIYERSQRLYHRYEKGYWGHDPQVETILPDDIRRHVKRDEEWRDAPLWLIDTGDLSTWGDDASIDMAKNMLAQCAKALETQDVICIHGNHDTWPERFPLSCTSKTARDRHREGLRDKHFNFQYPDQHVLVAPIPGTKSSVVLNRLNSAVHTRIRNSFAQGHIREDQYWRNSTSPQLYHQLEKLLEKSITIDGKRTNDMRIILSHHPINASFPNTSAGKEGNLIRLLDAPSIARFLSQPRQELGNEPLAHLILSGHTHAVYPPIGEMQHYHQNDENGLPFQLIAGSVSRLGSLVEFEDNGESPEQLADELLLDSYDEARYLPSKIPPEDEIDVIYQHQFQVLRFWKPDISPPDDRPYLVLERTVYGRRMGSGRFSQIQNTCNLSTNQLEHILLYY